MGIVWILLEKPFSPSVSDASKTNVYSNTTIIYNTTWTFSSAKGSI